MSAVLNVQNLSFSLGLMLGHRQTDRRCVHVCEEDPKRQRYMLITCEHTFVCSAVVTHAHRLLHTGCRLLTEEHVEYMQQFLPSKVRHFFVFVGCCGINFLERKERTIDR